MIKPILFNADMVRAILDGEKTVTRRLIKTPKDFMLDGKYSMLRDKQGETYLHMDSTNVYNNKVKYIRCPYRINDILYVRETIYQEARHYLDISGEIKSFLCQNFKYVATDEKPEDKDTVWIKRPSIHMPKEAARIFLKITDIRAEQLRDIIEEQAEKEGAQYYCPKCKEYCICGGDGFGKSCFKKLWNSTIDKKQLDQYGWDANPWVWVIEFEKCEKTETWCFN